MNILLNRLLLTVLMAIGVCLPASAARFSIDFHELTGDVSDGTNFFDDYTFVGRGSFEIANSAVSADNLVMFSDPEFVSFVLSVTLSTADTSTFVLGSDDFEEGDQNERGLLFDSGAGPLRFERLVTIFSTTRTMCKPICEVAVGSKAVMRLHDDDNYERIYLADGTVTTVSNNVTTEPFTPFAGDWSYTKGTSIGGSGINLGGVYTLYPDADGDGVADNDDLDDDNDGWADVDDNCPLVANPQQEDADRDTVGDACDNCISIENPKQEPSAVNPDCGAACETSGCYGLVCENR